MTDLEIQRLLTRFRGIESFFALRPKLRDVSLEISGVYRIDEFTLCEVYLEIFSQQLSLSLNHAVPRINLRMGSQHHRRILFLVNSLPKHRINPVEFFAFAIGFRQSKKVPPLLSNICTEKTINHFLAFRTKRSHSCSTLGNLRSIDEKLRSQLTIDLESGCLMFEKTGDLVTFFSYVSDITILLYREYGIQCPGEYEIEIEESIKFNPPLWDSLCSTFKLLNKHYAETYRKKVHPLRGEVFNNRMQKLVEFFSSI